MTPAGMSVLLAIEPVDMRRSFDGLARTVQEQLGRDAAGERLMFLFVNRRRDILKLLWRDATGWCLLCKRLDERVVQLPTNIPDGAVSVAIDARALAALLDGAKEAKTSCALPAPRLNSTKKMRTTDATRGRQWSILPPDEHHRRAPP